ncbi:MAG TPA: amylo-alpha-1,6-glucosidase [Anaerolineae bacterium]|nr:amylo-alpha-1,6-glucosidase [Anaerolineae bacterium]
MPNPETLPTTDLDFGREVCGDFAVASRKEWLVTNGIGGFASGTIAGTLTRRYHGLLIAALQPPLGRTLLATKLDETATYLSAHYPLFANHWASGSIEPAGFHHLERFHLEGATPVWTFACADALLEKRVWMQPGANTTYLQYHLRRGSAPLTLVAKALLNYRDYHGTTRAGDWPMQIEPVTAGLRITAFDGATPFYLVSARAEVTPRREWYTNFYLSVENDRGLSAIEDHFYAADFRAVLQPGEPLTIISSTDPAPNLDGESAYADRQRYEQTLLTQVRGDSSRRLVLAADQFIVARPTPGDPHGRTIIAGYPWFGDWGRDTMISLPGLTLATGRPDVARNILRTFAHFVDRGMLPNRFPDAGETPDYNTVDATLWYFEATRAYHALTGDDGLVRELYPVLADIVAWHQRGTRYNIHVDPDDGLLYAGEAGVQLTWMDAKIGDWVVTPRIGKPVEINALWYNALRSMAQFNEIVGGDSRRSPKRSEGDSRRPESRSRQSALRGSASRDASYSDLADRVKTSFTRFWHDAGGYCYDVIDGPDGADATLRPNQLFAVSLPYSPLAADRQRAVVDTCARQLLTSHGLRSLAPTDPAYVGHYGGDPYRRDAAYHQGTVWSWLIGPFVSAHLRVYRDPVQAQTFLLPLFHHLADHGLGSLSEIFDGDPPFTPRGCFAQAWSVAEVLRAWQEIAQYAET